MARIFILLLILLSCKSVNSQIFVSSLDQIPQGWKGPIFELSDNYPKSNPKDIEPWKNFDFRKNPKEYMEAVLKYFLEGNVEVGFVGQKNKVRKWYHAPSMSWQPSSRPYGREFVHGLTRERNSFPQELYSTQNDTIQNWAVGFYNSVGAYTLGRVWSDTINPKTQYGQFEEGTVSAKLLFTSASIGQVPYIDGAYEWDANIHKKIQALENPERAISKMRLLQLDIAVKDKRASATCWVFGTFVYNVNAPGKTIWDKLVPAGLMWGNDPTKLNGEELEETWINPIYVSLFRFPDGRDIHLGYKGRLNGPVDNLISSCISCHSTSQYPQKSKLTPDINVPESVSKYFRNIKCGELFDTMQGAVSLDYSLQLSGGIASLRQARAPKTKTALDGKEVEAIINYIYTSIDDDVSPNINLNITEEKSLGGAGKKNEGLKWYWWVLIFFAFVYIVSLFNSNSK
jgi:hypothetical protein